MVALNHRKSISQGVPRKCFSRHFFAQRPMAKGPYRLDAIWQRDANFQFSMTFNFTIFLCFSNIRNHLSNFSYLVCISCKIFICFWKLKIRVALPNRVRCVWTLKAHLHGRFCCDFSCDFLLLEDVKEQISYKCSRLWNLITTSLSNLLLHIPQKEKIATKIAAKLNRPRVTADFQSSHEAPRTELAASDA